MKRVSTPTGDGPAPKRTKASQACASCRRQKSRCEILDVRTQPGAGAAAVTIRCHRCKVLGVECSFETSDLIHFLPRPTPQTQTPPALVAVSPTVSETPSPPEIYGGLNTLATVASSRPNAEEVPVNSIPSRYGMLPEDLVPTATTPIWGCVSRVDWTATPMLAIQELVRCPRTDSGLQIATAGSLADILSPPEITSLLEIFETRYSPWLCAQPGSLECTNSLLDIVRCTIASRHLGPGARSAIAPRLQKLTEDVFVREIFNPQPPLESIKALLILSVWAPICGTGAEARDGRLLIASAVSMAMNLHLQNESKRAIGLRADKDGISPDKQAELDESTQRWRLWMHLSLSESMLCMGTGRAPVSHISQLDHDMASLATLPDFTLSAVRDIRLGLSAKMFQMTETALRARLKSADDLSAFFNTTNTSIYAMDGLGRLLTPLPVVTQHDTFYSQMLILQYHACRLLMMHHALRETRTVHERDRPLTPWYQVQTEGQCVALFWGRTALISAEAVLTSFLGASDFTLLSTAPDNLYVMVGFAATWLFVSNFSVYQLSGGKMGGASERLQAMTIDRLNRISHAQDHSAGRCGHVLGALLTAWERRKERGPPVRTADDGVCHCILNLPYDRPASAPAHSHDQHAHAHDQHNGNSTDYLNTPDFQDLANANSDLFMDDAFWASFIENLNSDTFIVQNSPVV
ncbi:hypothetical protein FB451DRAFT_1085095 [Mycena latifolia]|nr:hypothetical protein FB451DRAFT_1085095 [Mycena latifolia]